MLGAAALSLGLALILSYLVLDLPRVSFSAGPLTGWGCWLLD